MTTATPSSSVLSALPVLDAVARLGGFSAAAEALGVTQSAVSHRIKQLEAELGLPLFRRTTRRLEPTPEGDRLARAARDALRDIAGVLDDLRRSRSQGDLSISVLSSFAVKWLVPHLGGFHAEHSELRVSVLAQDDLSDLRSGRVDAAIRYTKRPGPGLHATRLGGDWLVPVASAGLFHGRRRPGAPSQLARYPLLADSTGEIDGTDFSWDAWCDALGLDGARFAERVSFNRADLMIQAAVGGQGIALGRAMLLEEDMLAASLLAPVGPAVPATAGYFFVTLPERAAWPKVELFRTWLVRELAVSRKRMTELLRPDGGGKGNRRRR